MAQARLTRHDEYPRHQTGGTFDSVASDSPHWNDGFYFTLGDEESGATLFVGLRLHPNTDVLDGFVCAAADGRQYNLRLSRRLRPSIDELRVGPLSLDILEPLRVLALRCEGNPEGVDFDLRWTGLHEPYFEDEIVRYSGGRKVYERYNYDQCCEVTGWLEIAGKRLHVQTDSWVGVRDHSWGLGRTGGYPHDGIAPDPAPDPRRGFAMRQWTMMRMPDRVLFWQFHLDDNGSFRDLEAVCLPDSGQPWRFVDARVDIRRLQGLPRVADADVDLIRPDGGTERYRLEPVGWPVYLQGGGYHDGFRDGRGRGVYRGELHMEGESWDVSHPINVVDPTGWFVARPDAWAQQFARCRNRDDDTDRGFGHLECVLKP
jgi:hypothetical protein